MKKVFRWCYARWCLIAVGFVLQGISIRIAYMQRGYKAYGGEYLVLPVVLMIGYLARSIVSSIREMLEGEDETRTEKDCRLLEDERIHCN